MKGVFLALRIFLAGIFLYAGAIKASASTQFAVALVPFTIVPASWLPAIAFILPWTEIAAAILVLPDRTKKIGAALMILLCAIFATVIAWALSNDIIVACSCFGRDETPSSWKMTLAIARDILLAAMACAVFFENRLRPPSRTPDSARKTPASA